MFAKIFESDKYGQLVVMKDQNDDGDPCVKFYYDPGVDGISICSSVLSAKKEEYRDKLFDRVDLEMAETAVGKVIKFLKDPENETL